MAHSQCTVEGLHCEYLTHPVGIDTAVPRLGWRLTSTERSQYQTAYQVQVASSPEELVQKGGVLWDSGKTASSRSVHVEYAGRALRAGARYHWRVRVWDRSGRASPWSEPATWQAAKLAPDDWRASWIAPGISRPQTRPEWKDFTLIADVTVVRGAVGILFRADDSKNFYMWQLNSAMGKDLRLRPHVCKAGQWSFLPAVSLRDIVPDAERHARHRIKIEVRGDRIRTFVDGKLADERKDATFAGGTVGFRSEGPEQGVVEFVEVRDANGKPLLRDRFEKDAGRFPGARVAGGRMEISEGVFLHGVPSQQQRELPKDCPRLRRVFHLEKPVRYAVASVCGLGFYELHLNGSKVGTRELMPANTVYDAQSQALYGAKQSRLLFDTYEVTERLRPGANALGLWLAPGYSDDYSKWGWKWLGEKQAILQLDIEFTDGSTTSVVTDGAWRSGSSPITYASLYHGEHFDARREEPGWNRPDFDAAHWKPVRVVRAPDTPFRANPMPPVRVMETLRPVAIREPRPGVFVADFGQNFAGWVRLRASGAAGTRITLRHAELAGANGMIDTWSNKGAKATDIFVLRGSEDAETYQPRFTYHGFRYVEVTGYPGRPTPDDLVGCVVHADVTGRTGRFRSSNELLNRIFANCVWGMRSNLMSIPTDTPARDERTPCQMDSRVYEEAAIHLFEMNRYYVKWLGDIVGGRGKPDWSGNGPLLAWHLYRYYADQHTLQSHYDEMRAYLEHLSKQHPSHLISGGFGDWCAPGDGSFKNSFRDPDEVNTALYALLARTLAQAAEALEKPEDVRRYNALADAIGQAFHKKYFQPETATYGSGSQTTSLLPLKFGMVPEANRQAVFDRLVKTIEVRRKGHLHTGITGTRFLVDVLCENGRPDLAMGVLTKTTYPSFGYQIAMGATTTWEQWSFRKGMQSFNHAMFAGIAASFYTHFAGITPLEPGYRRIRIHPYLPPQLDFVEAETPTVKGTVAVKWERKGDRQLELTVTIPANTQALVHVPTVDRQSVREGDQPAEQANGVVFEAMQSGRAVFRIGSGTYIFTSVIQSRKSTD
jgi:hypothetical protein